jgi:hypothetical protein
MGQAVSTPKTNVNRRNNNLEMGKPYAGPTMRNLNASPDTSIPISELREVRTNTNNSSMSMSGGKRKATRRNRKSKKSRKAKKTRGRK